MGTILKIGFGKAEHGERSAKNMGERTVAKEGIAAPFQVKWIGAQKDVLKGDLTARIALHYLEGLSSLYAVGPLEGLKGEVTILHSVPSISRVEEGKRIVIDSSFCNGACFLAYVQVGHWHEVALPSRVLREAELEWFLPEAAAAIGIDPGEPFPYLLEGTPRSVEFHILNKIDNQPHNRERHERAKVHFRLKASALTIIGFYSSNHRGIFTPGHSSIHQHVVTKGGAVAGHVDGISLTPGVRLFLPDPYGPRI
jgi:acetolactate decarboxylase